MANAFTKQLDKIELALSGINTQGNPKLQLKITEASLALSEISRALDVVQSAATIARLVMEKFPSAER